MYFFEVIRECDTDEVVREFLKFCDESPDIQHTETALRQAISRIKVIEPKLSDDYLICIEKAEALDESVFDEAFVLDKKNSTKYSLEANPWADTLGYPVNLEHLSAHGKEYFSALVLWEMTWFGFSEEKIQAKVNSWNSNER